MSSYVNRAHIPNLNPTLLFTENLRRFFFSFIFFFFVIIVYCCYLHWSPSSLWTFCADDVPLLAVDDGDVVAVDLSLKVLKIFLSFWKDLKQKNWPALMTEVPSVQHSCLKDSKAVADKIVAVDLDDFSWDFQCTFHRSEIDILAPEKAVDIFLFKFSSFFSKNLFFFALTRVHFYSQWKTSQ